MMNNWAVLPMLLVAWTCRSMMEMRYHSDGSDGQAYSFYVYHMALNIVSFPVIFFFSSLYYTDVYSTLLVLVCYQNHLARLSYDRPPLWRDLWTILLGIFALSMRQTNIFWISIYMGGMEAVHAIKSLKPAKVQAPPFATVLELVRFYGLRYSAGEIHDPPLLLAWPDGRFFLFRHLEVRS